jgi:hypothetical protein
VDFVDGQFAFTTGRQPGRASLEEEIAALEA